MHIVRLGQLLTRTEVKKKTRFRTEEVKYEADCGLIHTLKHFRCPEGGAYRNELTFMTKVVFLMSMGNWSVSQPRSGEPVLESTEPSMPSLSTIKQR